MEQLSLFDNREKTMPLASRLRPEILKDYVGQSRFHCRYVMCHWFDEENELRKRLYLC